MQPFVLTSSSVTPLWLSPSLTRCHDHQHLVTLQRLPEGKEVTMTTTFGIHPLPPSSASKRLQKLETYESNGCTQLSAHTTLAFFPPSAYCLGLIGAYYRKVIDEIVVYLFSRALDRVSAIYCLFSNILTTVYYFEIFTCITTRSYRKTRNWTPTSTSSNRSLAERGSWISFRCSISCRHEQQTPLMANTARQISEESRPSSV